jgi:hypothetical protein
MAVVANIANLMKAVESPGSGSEAIIADDQCPNSTSGATPGKKDQLINWQRGQPHTAY